MQSGKTLRLFVFFVLCAAAFVLLTSARLPALVASHFGSTGTANGFMPHDVYVYCILAVVVGLPAATVVITWLAIARPDARINLPNKAYWLAPERRASTVGYLRSGIVCFGILLVAFLCYVHWLVVLANGTHPPHLANSWFLAGLVVFFAALLIWMKLFLGRFRQAD
jgi:hypothetical protein